MKLPKEITTVTPLSKAVALIMFISLPIIAFFFGMRYQTMLLEQNISLIPTPISVSPTAKPETAPIVCTMDAKICPDGSGVGRVGPDCQFAKCPSPAITSTFCGGIRGISCPSGYYCKYDGTYPDAGGTCLKN